MYERILVPTDGSDEAEVAMTAALDLVGGADASVHVLTVLTTPRYGSSSVDVAEPMLEGGEELVAELADIARDAGVPVTTAVEVGRPAREILQYVEDNEIDLVVMGTRGQGDLENRLLGSVTRYVVTHADVPVHVMPATT